jgi:hypothetical protein
MTTGLKAKHQRLIPVVIAVVTDRGSIAGASYFAIRRATSTPGTMAADPPLGGHSASWAGWFRRFVEDAGGRDYVCFFTVGDGGGDSTGALRWHTADFLSKGHNALWRELKLDKRHLRRG